jgi:hypothetical protein
MELPSTNSATGAVAIVGAIHTSENGVFCRRRIQNMGLEDVMTAPQSPWQSPYVERLIGNIRRGVLDHVIILNERHLRYVLQSYLRYYTWHGFF